MNFVPWLLLLHILGAVIAFGPVFSFPLIGAMGGREPMHAVFATRLSAAISDRVIIPLAAVQGITGLLLLFAAGHDLTQPRDRWLITAIVLYLITFGFATAVQRRNVHSLIELISQPRSPDAPPGPPAGAPALIRKVQQGGILLTVLIVAIIFLMVIKPGY